MKTHDLKTWPQFFRAVWDDQKLAELRRNDRDFQYGDTLILHEFDPVDDGYSGRRIEATVSHIVYGPAFGLEKDHVMMSMTTIVKFDEEIPANAR